jgi:2,3-bisphosphoglycerate-dependent phosphoglycerate mutase
MSTREIRIFLVRHGQSEANLDKAANARLPDHRIELSSEGYDQAKAAAEFLSDRLRSCPRVRILRSPYMRARQTAAAFEQVLRDRKIPFDIREAVELRELEFGLFDGVADADLEAKFPREYAHYHKHKQFEGEFFAPMPLGESRCAVAQRVKSIFGTILRDASAERAAPIRDFVVVSHGVTIRCFRMQWMHYPWEWYEAERNPRNCSIQLIEGHPSTPETDSDFSGSYSDTLIYPGFAPPQPSQQTRREEGVVGSDE